MTITELRMAGTKNKQTGLPIAEAKIWRDYNSDYITVHLRQPTLTSPGHTREHKVMADDETDVFSMAEILQECLDGYRGTNSDIHSYYCLLQHFMD